ncbi:hypothetical protein [Hymenobacter yonginensis]|uniref:Uncharacterized protein n=1 Tax=Hymenobacter yonginensis TaxID=748197 RepID=A0ABY7PT31_9BACT|nr:hypothetical protein [Hymenobacter yonginensis]WBO86064.1 hypothetical protein O9Z63_07365 [Hymenobacter yonginensis]
MTTEILQVQGVAVRVTYSDTAHKERLIIKANELLSAGHSWWDSEDQDGGFFFDRAAPPQS